MYKSQLGPKMNRNNLRDGNSIKAKHEIFHHGKCLLEIKTPLNTYPAITMRCPNADKMLCQSHRQCRFCSIYLFILYLVRLQVFFIWLKRWLLSLLC